MPSLIVRAFLAALFIAAPLSAQVDRDELLAKPKHASKDRRPVFKSMSEEEVRSAIRVTSSRSSALFGFNNAEVQVHLPRVDNSNWIEEKFSGPKLLDRKKREVRYEKEQGIYNHDTWSTEIRFLGIDGKPLEFAQAVGSVRIRYPRVMKTRSLKKSDVKSAAEAGVVFDGPFVKIDLSKVPESAFGSELDGVRAYDKGGKRLEKVMGYSSSSWQDDVSYRGFAFHGDVARVDFDVAEQWVTLAIDYDMPPAPKLPDTMAGASSKPNDGTATPGGQFTVKIVPND